MNERRGQTIKYYNEHAYEWLARTRTEVYWLPEISRFRGLLPLGKILEIGPGAGIEARFFINHGYAYLGIDASEGMLKIAREKNPEAMFIKGAVEEMRFPKEYVFDGFWASASLLHVEKKDIDSALKNIVKVIRLGGIGFVAMKEGVGEIQDEKGWWYSYYSFVKFAKILERNNLTIIESKIRKEEENNWLTYFVRVAK